MTILITGGAGFIGSNFIKYYLSKYYSVKIVNIDKLTYAGNLNNLDGVETNPRYRFIHGDICDKDLINELFVKYSFKGVIHFAAESHVDNSIDNPNDFIHTNINGTFNLLNAARNHWMKSSNEIKTQHINSRFHHISTDEVYGSLGKKGLFTEETSYAPNSPYSASKASSDFLVRSYFKTYNMNVVTTNCSNNYGPRQHDEKLIPTVIRKALNGENIPIYGDGQNIRDWLYVKDHCFGIDLVFNKGVSGETYNIGGNNEHNNMYIASTICSILDELAPKKTSYKDQIIFVEDRLGHDFRYAIDESKIKNQLGWKAKENFQTGLKKTINWYIKKYKN
ncbi:dTDP-glucose 4,6-dehydratase [Hyunsoonleella pacifica]|uniref:dTDP-glucose 4,6-dehydratase n=1 Tax=Hyunsoonleella pacifica TaxID=1080224 RepID=A0A4Q9FSM3_9FLAO|nr:dTDP-glucose 4,6-dehydratase [Hyunsoonleella pacifica]TBN16727.1 dTDP-glucose 4,6-dehydratase [Hyunsoonleella pacifica]GGD16952.1 dTDP-glucose 4,6-dehydratase [Hyunsoonleella pacifica]